MNCVVRYIYNYVYGKIYSTVPKNSNFSYIENDLARWGVTDNVVWANGGVWGLARGCRIE